jgi:cellulose biosynthesis protein BcsQ
MRILQIGKFFPPYHFGGIETVSCNLYQGLIGRGIKTCFLGFLPLGIKHDISKDGNIYLCKTNIDIFSAQLSLSFIRIWKQIKDDYDIIILNLPHPFANLVINIFPPKISRI